MPSLNLATFTDESGQETEGKMFVVCTVICNSKKYDFIEKTLEKVEKESGKHLKWNDVSDLRKSKYVETLLKYRVLDQVKIYLSVYEDRKDYTTLVAANIVKSIITHAKGQKYSAKVFVDLTNKAETTKIRKEINYYKVKYRKVRGISEESNAFIRLADAACGAKRHLDKGKKMECYKKLCNKFVKLNS